MVWLVSKALAKDPVQRYPDAGAFAAALEKVEEPARVPVDTRADSQPRVPPAKPTARRWWRRGYLWAAISLVLVLGGVLLGQILGRGSPGILAGPVATETATPEPSSTATPPPTPTAAPPTPNPPGAASKPPACTVAGQNWASPVDEMQMVCIPSGKFSMGSITGNNNEKPVHEVYLDAYWLDRYEVSNDQYQQCVTVGVCTPPQDTSSTKYPSYYGNEQYAIYPVINVDWNQAAAYCRWAGKRLPSEAEWEKAARGTDKRTYPWGEEINCASANYWGKDGGCVGDTSAVGGLPGGASPYGALDMAGNVWEWVNDWYSENSYIISAPNNPTGPATELYRVQRGGSWSYNLTFARTTNRFKNNPDSKNSDVGFRCAVSAATP